MLWKQMNMASPFGKKEDGRKKDFLGFTVNLLQIKKMYHYLIQNSTMTKYSMRCSYD